MKDYCGYINVADPEWLEAVVCSSRDTTAYPRRVGQELRRGACVFLCKRGEMPRKVHAVGRFDFERISTAGMLADYVNKLSSVTRPTTPFSIEEAGIVWNSGASNGRYLDRGEVVRLLSLDSAVRNRGPALLGQGIALDQPTRAAIERRAEEFAVELYRAEGYAVFLVGDIEPYDLQCVRGDCQVRVEVKGCSSQPETVILTSNEVKHARSAPCRVDLVVISDVAVSTDAGGTAVGSGGKLHCHIRGWCPHDADLQATEYRYRVPTSDRLE